VCDVQPAGWSIIAEDDEKLLAPQKLFCDAPGVAEGAESDAAGEPQNKKAGFRRPFSRLDTKTHIRDYDA